MQKKRGEKKREIITFKESEIKKLLSVIKPFTLFKDLDKENVFENEGPNKGILGHVIEKSVFGIPANSFQNADIKIISGRKVIPTEVKTTGVHDRELLDGEKFHAKECTSLTAVSIGVIENEKWKTSHFYEKIAHMLWVFYYYKRDKGEKIVPNEKYPLFPVLGYKFTHLEDFPEDLEKFKSDWMRTREFLRAAKKFANPKDRYPQLHSKIKKDLFFVDIAPKYKEENGKITQEPRFRIKKSYVNSVFQQFWNDLENESAEKVQLESWGENCNSFADIERELYERTKYYKGKTIGAIIKKLGIKKNELDIKDKDNWPKSIAEQVFVRMIGCSLKKISNIDLFNRIGIIAKTITITERGSQTEDTKLFTMNLDEIRDKELAYEDTSYYHYFNDFQFLCIIFREPSKDAPLKDNKFVGIKRLVFPDFQTDKEIKRVYEITCDLINNGKVVEKYCKRKDGSIIYNPNGLPKTFLNFPKAKEEAKKKGKAKENKIFVRGTGLDSSHKSWTFEGKNAKGEKGKVLSYPLQFWIKGSFITELLKSIKFIGEK